MVMRCAICLSTAASLLRHMRRRTIQMRRDEERRDVIWWYQIRSDHMWKDGRSCCCQAQACASSLSWIWFVENPPLAWIHRRRIGWITFRRCVWVRVNNSHVIHENVILNIGVMKLHRQTRARTHTQTVAQTAATDSKAAKSIHWLLHVNEALQCYGWVS